MAPNLAGVSMYFWTMGTLLFVCTHRTPCQAISRTEEVFMHIVKVVVSACQKLG